MLAVAVVVVLAAALPMLSVVLAVDVAELSARCQLVLSRGLDIAELSSDRVIWVPITCSWLSKEY